MRYVYRFSLERRDASIRKHFVYKLFTNFIPDEFLKITLSWLISLLLCFALLCFVLWLALVL